MRYPAGLRALNQADYRRFFLAQLLALTGSWMQTVAQSWLVLSLTDSPFRLGLIGTLQFAPVLLLSIPAGALADRVRKRRLLVGTQATLGAQALLLGLLAWSGRAEYWHVAVLAVVSGVANAIDMPVRQSYVAELVGTADVVNAVALNSASFNAARIVGPAVAGVVIARVGVAPVFLLNSAGFVVTMATLAALATEGRPRPRGASTVLQEIGEGIRYAARTPRIRIVLGVLLVVSLCVFNFTVYVPLLARNVLGLGAEAFGFLMAALGVGAVLGALTVGTSRAREPALSVMFGAAGAALALLLGMSAVRDLWVAVPMLFVLGFFGLIVVASCNTAMQVAAPDELRGRVMSLYTLVWGGVFPIGAFLVGSISEAWGVSRAFFLGGAVGLAALAALGVGWRLRRS